MHLKLQRSQKAKGMMSSTIVFCLDARMQLTLEESGLVKKYGLGKQTVYDSATREKHLAQLAATAAGGSMLKGLVSAAMSRLSLHVTIDSLTNGQHIEAKDLDELLGAEQAVIEGCKAAKTYLQTAQSFDGREEVIEL